MARPPAHERRVTGCTFEIAPLDLSSANDSRVRPSISEGVLAMPMGKGKRPLAPRTDLSHVPEETVLSS